MVLSTLIGLSGRGDRRGFSGGDLVRLGPYIVGPKSFSNISRSCAISLSLFLGAVYVGTSFNGRDGLEALLVPNVRPSRWLCMAISSLVVEVSYGLINVRGGVMVSLTGRLGKAGGDRLEGTAAGGVEGPHI